MCTDMNRLQYLVLSGVTSIIATFWQWFLQVMKMFLSSCSLTLVRYPVNKSHPAKECLSLPFLSRSLCPSHPHCRHQQRCYRAPPGSLQASSSRAAQAHKSRHLLGMNLKIWLKLLKLCLLLKCLHHPFPVWWDISGPEPHLSLVFLVVLRFHMLLLCSVCESTACGVTADQWRCNAFHSSQGLEEWEAAYSCRGLSWR